MASASAWPARAIPAPAAHAPGDLYIIVRIAEHPIFRRDADDISMTLPILPWEAALGAKIEVPTIDGRTVLRIPPGTQSGQKLRMREKGVPSATRPGVIGDQIVEIRIVVPEIPNVEAKDLWQKLEKLHPEDPRAQTVEQDLESPMTKRKGKGAYMISVVAEMYEIHPQTLRLYEREGLLKPSRSEGNTRLYTEEDLKRLEFILSLARDLGVNIAGIGIILNMRERMEQMQMQMQEFVKYVQQEVMVRANQAMPKEGLVPVRRPVVIPPGKKK